MKPNRILSIDLLRGLVMIIMALDHVRDYFHADSFLYSPTDLEKTSVVLFFTRWITHFCAPTFVFLAGTSVYLVARRKDKKEMTSFLLTRGLWLVFLELVIVNFGWFFNVHLPMLGLLVIWTIGMSFIVMALMIHLPYKVIMITGLILVFLHNALDGFHVESSTGLKILWSIIHEQALFPLDQTHVLFVAYPLIPWIGVMMLGYCLGSLFTPEVDGAFRKRRLMQLGVAAIGLFIVIRAINIYGDPNPWTVQPNAVYTALSFINVSKYPPSLLYVLVTLGPALVFLSLSEGVNELGWRHKVITFGRVPMFYYLAHIYLIHILAIVAALYQGYSLNTMFFNTWISFSPELKGYGFNLGITYLIWIALVAMLYPLCAWYSNYRTAHPNNKWLSYV